MYKENIESEKIYFLGWELANSGDPECLGVFYGLIGQVDLLLQRRLLLVREVAYVGELQGRGTIYKIRSISLLQVTAPLPNTQF